ncbi:12611_t:CDS:2 [Funneliformis caledonium]|uniref:12611_t:CDS:1 n=1 Tax=Funneliformis caledonium TaxID=1117310 RepID=A0A9N9CMC4_9GLOM|nr:12611_t:CDS:2 [Funneliformis caledonium]
MNRFIFRSVYFRTLLKPSKLYPCHNSQFVLPNLSMNYFFSSKSDSSNICYNIEGFINCSYFNAAVDLGKNLKSTLLDKGTPIEVNVEAHKKENASILDKILIKILHSMIPNSKDHTTSPLVYEGCNPGKYKFIGGYSDFAKLVRDRHKSNLQKDSKEGGRECEGDVCKI